MKNLNFLSNLCGLGRASQSSDVGSRCRVVADLLPSFCRVKHVLTLLVVMLFTIGEGQMWGATTYTLIKSNSSLSNGDKVVIIKSSTTPTNGSSTGVTGFSGTKDATVGTSESGWVQYTVGSASASGWTLYDETAKKYIASPSGNEFKYNASAGTCSVNGDGVLVCNSRYLVQNSSYYRFYGSIGSYDPFYVWKVGSGTTPTLTVSGGATSLDVGDAKVNGSGVTNSTLAFSGSNLTANATLSISGTNASMFSVTPTNVSKGSGTITNQTITVTYTPTSAGSHSATLTIASSGATSKTIALSGTGKYEVVWKNNGGDYTTTLVASGSRPTFPDAPSSCDAGEGASTTFYGWSTGTWSGKTNDLAGKTIYTSAASMPTVSANGTTYHAVFCKGGGGSVTITNKMFTDALSASYSTVNITSGDYTFEVNACKQDSKCQMRDNATLSYIAIPTLPGVISRITATTVANGSGGSYSSILHFKHTKSRGNANTNDITKLDCSSSAITSLDWDVSGSNSTYKAGYLLTSGGLRLSDLTIYYGGSGTNYMTTCCTALGSINGSVSLSNAGCNPGELKATWKMLATTGIASQTLRVYDENLEEVTDKRITGITASTSNQTKTISGLNPCKEYYVTVENISSSGEYCAPGDPWESEVVTTLGYTYTITKNNVSLKGGESEAARACEDFMAEYVANTGYALPTTISVSGASAYEWEDGVLAIEKANVTGNVTVTISGTCVEPAISAGPADANYYVGDSPTPLSVTATLASGTLTYLWKVSTNGGSTWSDAEGTNNAATYSGASLSTASAGTLKFKCIVGNSQGGCTVESGVATITVSNASYFPNGKTIFIQAGKSGSAWSDNACVVAWFHSYGGSETAQPTYWLFDVTAEGDDKGKKLFAAVVPSSGDLPYLDINRYASNCTTPWNKNGGVSYSDASGSNTIRSEGSGNDQVYWNLSGVTIDLHGDPSGDEWASSLASFSDQGAGVWTATYNNYAPANAAGESQEFKAKTNYNGWIGNTGSNNNATLDGMHVGSTYNITATLDVTDHSLVMSKEFVKGTVHFDLQGHGLAISDLENVAAGSKISAPSAPSATGYTFGGWFKEPACTNEWTFASDVVNETMTLYAKWTANVYTITKTFTNVAIAGLPASFTYTGATTTALNSTFTVNTTNFFLPSSIAVTMGGSPLTAGTDYTYNNSTGAFTFDRIINGNIVITATATAKLLSIAITTQPTTRKYFAGESFSSTGAVVTATMGAGTKTVSATWTPSGALSAGTSQTVTASYTENGITKTATTTIDVYSVTVNKVNEDGDGIDAAGVTATWTVGTKALAAGVGSTKYVFKQWEVTGASIGSTTSTSTTLSSPMANVVVNAVFYKPVTVSWTKGGTAYGTGSPTTEVARGTQWKDLTIPTAPGDATLGACANKFMGWSNCSDLIGTGHSAPGVLFTSVSGITTAINDPIEFKAVFATENSGTWTLDYSAETALSSSTDWGSYGTAYDYTASDGGTWTVKAYKNAGMQINTTKNASIKIPDCSGDITSIEITCSAAKAVGLSASDYTGSGAITYIAYGTDATSQTIDCSGASATGGYIVPKSGSTSITKIVVNYGATADYVTQCDANQVRVTYDANGGSTTCAGGTHDKRNDYTVCSSAPTRDYYTFAGWLCSADSKTYAASATIDDAVIDADFTLTAQWTPVPYSITYNYNGGSAQVDPVPATSYTVESSDITLQTPTKGHDRFDGWYENADLSTGGVKTTIPAGSHENKTYYAKWTARHEIIFDYTGSASSGTTTIYRADDEDLSASVAGQGSVPSDPSAPTACSSKVFVGWSESIIDGETDTEPGDLMKPAAGTVDADKHYYAVWAIAAGSSGTMTYGWEDADATTGWTNIKAGTSSLGSYVSAHGGSKAANAAASAADTQTEVVMIQTVNKIQITALSFYATKEANNTAAASWILQQSDDGSSWEDIDFWNASSVTRGTWTKYELAAAKIDEITSGAYIRIILSTASTSKRDIDDLSISYDGTSYSAYSTSCCDKEVTIGTPTKTGSGTVTFESGGNAVSVGGSVKTCNGSTTITATVTPTNGYQCTVLSFSRSDEAALTPDPAISVPFTGAQSYDLTFEQNADGVTLNTTVTFVALIDHYIDNMHYNTTQNKSGNYGTAPTLSDESKGEQCTGLHYKFVGWIPETDMNMTTGVPTTTANMVAGGATGKYATGTNYYAIWAEEVTP